MSCLKQKAYDDLKQLAEQARKRYRFHRAWALATFFLPLGFVKFSYLIPSIESLWGQKSLSHEAACVILLAFAFIAMIPMLQEVKNDELLISIVKKGCKIEKASDERSYFISLLTSFQNKLFIWISRVVFVPYLFLQAALKVSILYALTEEPFYMIFYLFLAFIMGCLTIIFHRSRFAPYKGLFELRHTAETSAA